MEDFTTEEEAVKWFQHHLETAIASRVRVPPDAVRLIHDKLISRFGIEGMVRITNTAYTLSMPTLYGDNTHAWRK
jgi:hypothetical protein